MKLKRELLEVQCSNGQPQIIRRRGRQHTVQCVLDRWMYRSRWWAREEQRHYWKVQCADLCLELFEHNGRWYSSGLWD